MKKFTIKLSAFFLALVLVVAFAVSAAASSVTFDGDAQKFIFAPGSDYSPTDLFENFKGMMPGDKESQDITVKNTAKYKANIYIRSLGATDETQDFVSQLKLTVVENGKSELFNAPASEPAQLSDWVSLGTLEPGGQADLTVTVEVPTDLSNEYQGAVGELKWEFKVEEVEEPTEAPTKPASPDQPKTGDYTNILLYVGIAALGVVLVVILVATRKKKKDNE